MIFLKIDLLNKIEKYSYYSNEEIVFQTRRRRMTLKNTFCEINYGSFPLFSRN